MAKLYGTADPTLVAAAFKHGASMTPGDMKYIYALKAANVKAFGEGISKMFDSIYADNKNTMDLLNNNATKALDIMEAGGVPNDWGVEMNSDVVNDYKDRLKAINAEYGMGKGGDLERSKLRAEMNRYLSNIESGGDMFVNMVSNAANSRLLNDLGDDKAKLFNLMVEDHNNGTSIAKPSYENGEIVYSVPGSDVKLSMREINEGMSAHDPKFLNGIQQKLTSFQARGKAMGGQMTADDALRFKNELQSSITSWDEIRNVSQEKFGNMKFTFEQVLTGQAKDPITGAIDTDLLSNIYDELEALGSIDIDDDGDIDETDRGLLAQAKAEGEIYTDAGNGFTLIDALKKDKQKYRDVMANYLTETAVKDFYGQGAAQFKPKGGKGGGDDKKTGKYGGWGRPSWYTKPQDGSEPRYITWGVAEERRNDLDNLDKVVGFHGTYTWNSGTDDKDGFYTRDDGKTMSMFEVAREEGLINKGESKNDFNPIVSKTENEEKQYSNKGLATPSMLRKVTGDNDASNKLNEKFKFSVDSETDYYFTPYSLTVGEDNVFTDDVMLIDRKTGRPVKVNGEVRRFGTGKDYNIDDLKWINDFLKDYLPKLDINTDFED